MIRTLAFAAAWLVGGVWSSVVSAGAQPVSAAGAGPRPSLTAAAWARPVVYRLAGDSGSLLACFDPCDCVLHVESDLIGTMQLSALPSATPMERRYRVSDVNFRVSENGQDVLIRGEGTYTWYSHMGSLTVLAHRMELDLRVGDEESRRYDSGVVGGASDGRFPPIRIQIDHSNQECFDRVLTIDAAPVSPAEFIPYRLDDDSTYTRGCLPPCLCPLLETRPVTGGMVMVPLEPMDQTPGVQEWAVVNIGWAIVRPQAEGAVSGSGFYSVTPAAAVPFRHRLLVGLTFDGQGERVWNSGWAELNFNDVVFPPQRLEIDAALNGFFCFDEVFAVRARRP